MDIFEISDFLIISKISKEVAIFIGANQDDNVSVLANILEIFEESLSCLTKNVSRKNLMENYQGLVILVDEMIDEGVVINTDAESLETKIFNKDLLLAGETGMSSGGSNFGSVFCFFV